MWNHAIYLVGAKHRSTGIEFKAPFYFFVFTDLILELHYHVFETYTFGTLPT